MKARISGRRMLSMNKMEGMRASMAPVTESPMVMRMMILGKASIVNIDMAMRTITIAKTRRRRMVTGMAALIRSLTASKKEMR